MSCGPPVDDSYVIENDPGKVEHIDGTDLAKVSLTPKAAQRLQIETTPALETADGDAVVPATAIFVDPDGIWWVYTSVGRNAFVRHEVEIGREDGRQVFLSSGPDAGTEIVTVGVAELYGIEAEVGH